MGESKPKKSDYCEVECIVRVRKRVALNGKLTKAEAKAAVERGDWYDITDEEELSVVEIVSVELL